MKIFKYLLFLVLIGVIGIAIYIAVQPNDFSFNRSKIINAPQALLYNKVNDYKVWPEFSPWIEKEPNAQLTYNDITSGKNAGYSWKGEELGIGSMRTLNADPYKSIDQKIIFVEPFKSESNIYWSFEPVDGGTKVTWKMEGKQDFMTKMYTTFMGSIEKSTGPDFERGLFKLDSITQVDMNKFEITLNGLTEHSGGFYLYTSASSKIDNLTKKIGETIPKIGGFAISNNISMAGSPFTIYHLWDPQNNAVRFSTCIPTTDRVITTEDNILTGKLEPFRALKVTLAGNYSHLQEAWDMARKSIAENPEIEEAEDGTQLEVYVVDATKNPNPSKWITEIYIAIKDL